MRTKGALVTIGALGTLVALATFFAVSARADNTASGVQGAAPIQFVATADQVAALETALNVDLDQDATIGAPSSNGQGATVFNDFPCLLFTPDVPPGFLVTTDSHAVVTPSGNATLVCHGQLPVGPPSAVVIEDLGCLTQGGGLPPR